MNAKYAAGQAEHGGNLWEKPLCRELDMEVTDFLVYWRTFRDRQLPNIRRMLDRAKTEPDQETRAVLIDEALRFLE